ncbi:MAG: spore protease YyaC [Clostridia bacterium]|nr:spore protease YyaC [Clostridia bacterium]
MPKPVILCIGTDNIVGDSLGPAVGDLLVMKYGVDAYVYGRRARPVNGVNYAEYLDHIKKHHKHNFIIAVDACIGDHKDVGKIKCTRNGLSAGGALDKRLGRVGDLGILGIVAAVRENNFEALKDVDSSLVNALSAIAAELISKLVLRINGIQKKRLL